MLLLLGLNFIPRHGLARASASSLVLTTESTSFFGQIVNHFLTSTPHHLYTLPFYLLTLGQRLTVRIAVLLLGCISYAATTMACHTRSLSAL